MSGSPNAYEYRDQLNTSGLSLNSTLNNTDPSISADTSLTEPLPPTTGSESPNELTDHFQSSLHISSVLKGAGLHKHTPPYSSPSLRYSSPRAAYQYTPAQPRTRAPFGAQRAPRPSYSSAFGGQRAPRSSLHLKYSYRSPKPLTPPQRLAQHLHLAPPSQASFKGRTRRYVMAPLPHVPEADFLVPDSAIPPLPEFGFLDHTAESQPSAHITLKHHLVSQLRTQFECYNTLSLQTRQLETKPVADRENVDNQLITDSRKRLSSLYTSIRELLPQLEHIIAVQDKDQPTLPCYDEPQNPNALRIQELKEFLGNSSSHHDPSSRPLRETWNKLKIYAELHRLSHADFKLALLSCTTADVFDYIKEYKNLSLPELSRKLANRFVSEQPISDATSALNTFTRKTNEPLRQAVARLQSLVDKALMAFAPDKRDVLREHYTTQHLRAMITPKARRFIDTKATESRLQGLTLQLDDMVRLASQEESRTGMPQSDLSNPVSLYNLESSDASPQNHYSRPPPDIAGLSALESKLDAVSATFDSKVDLLTDLIQDMSETNLAFVDHLAPPGDYEEPSYDSEPDCEINVLTRSQYRQNPRTDAKTLTRPEPGSNNKTRYNAQRQQQSRRDQYSGRYRNIAQNIARQADAVPRVASRTQPTASNGPSAAASSASPSASASATSASTTPAPSAPSQRSPTPDRGRPRSRDDRNDLAQRYPSYSREILQYPVPEPKPSSLSPADYYKQKAEALQAKLQTRDRSQSQTRRPDRYHLRPDQRRLPPDSDFDPPARPQSFPGHLSHDKQSSQMHYSDQYHKAPMHQLIPDRQAADKPYFVPPGPTVVHTHDNTHVSINAPCVYCHSPVPHGLEDCYTLRPVLNKLTRSKPQVKPSENTNAPNP